MLGPRQSYEDILLSLLYYNCRAAVFVQLVAREWVELRKFQIYCSLFTLATTLLFIGSETGAGIKMDRPMTL